MDVTVTVARRAKQRRKLKVEAQALPDDLVSLGERGVADALFDPLADPRLMGPSDPADPGARRDAPGGAASSDGEKTVTDGEIARGLASGGAVLPDRLREAFERALAHRLDHVRVHEGPAADALARQVGAEAFTLGSHVVLGGGVSLSSPGGRRTLAHELVHVMQFDEGRVPRGDGVLDAGHAIEREAYGAEDRVVGEAEAWMRGDVRARGLSRARGPEGMHQAFSDAMPAVEGAVAVLGDLMSQGALGDELSLAAAEVASAIGSLLSPTLREPGDRRAVQAWISNMLANAVPEAGPLLEQTNGASLFDVVAGGVDALGDDVGQPGGPELDLGSEQAMRALDLLLRVTGSFESSADEMTRAQARAEKGSLRGKAARIVDVPASKANKPAPKGLDVDALLGALQAGGDPSSVLAALGSSIGGLLGAAFGDGDGSSVATGAAAGFVAGRGLQDRLSKRQAQGDAARHPFGERLAAAFGEAFPEGLNIGRGRDVSGARGATVDGEVLLGSGADLHVVAHEVAHVVQQRSGLVPDGYRSRPGDAFEQQADAVADAVVAGGSVADVASFAAVGSTAPVGQGAGSEGAVQADSGKAAAGSAIKGGGKKAGPNEADAPPEGHDGTQKSAKPKAAAKAKEKKKEKAGDKEAPSENGADAVGDAEGPAPQAVDLLGGAGGEGAAGGGGGGGGATLPTGAGTKAPDVTAAFKAMSPSTQVIHHKGLAGALQGAAEGTKAATDEAAPELHAELKSDTNLPDPGALEVAKDTKAKKGAVEEARDKATPEHDEGDVPKVGHSPVRPSSIANWFEKNGSDNPEEGATKAIQSAQRGGNNIPTKADAPKLDLTGKADPKQGEDAAKAAKEQSATALADGRKAILTGPGPEVVQLLSMDEKFEAPVMAAPKLPDFGQQVKGMDQYQEWSLPANIQAEFDKQQAPTINAHLAEADKQVAEAQGDFETQQTEQIASTEAQVAEAQADAQRQQEEAVTQSRQDIQDTRRETMEKQDAAVKDLHKQVADERTAVMSDIDQRVSSDQVKVDRTMADAQKKADAEVAKGDRQADQEAKKAEEEDEGFWGSVFGAIADAVSAITDAIVAVWDAVREAVTAILDAAVSLANTLIDAAISFVSEALGAFLDMLTAVVGELLGAIFPELAAYLQEKLQEFKQWAQAKLQELGNWLKEKVKAFADGLKAALNAIFDALIGALKFASAFLEAVITGDWDKVLSMTIDAIFALAGITRAEFEEKYGSAEVVFKSVIEDPGKLISNAIEATGKGFDQFGEHFTEHFMSGAIEWISGSTGITMPKTFDLGGVFSVVAQVLGLDKEGIKGKVEKHAGKNAAEVFDYAWEAVSAMIAGGWEGLWEHLQGVLSGLWDMAIGAVTEWITEKLILRAAQFIATLSTGFGAILEAVIALWNFGSWLYDNIQKIMGIVQTVLRSTIDFVAGNIQPAADKIESLLAQLIPVAIDLVTKMLGLGGLPGKIKEIIGKTRGMVDNAIDKMVEKVVKAFKPKKGKDNAKDKDKDKPKSQFDGEIGETVKFAAGGEGHKLWIDNSGGKAKVMVASTPMTVEERLQDWNKRLSTYAPAEKDGKKGPEKAEVGGWISKAAQLLGVTIADANEVIVALEKEKSARAPASGSASATGATPGASNVDKKDQETEKAEEVLATTLKALFDAFGDTHDSNLITAVDTLKTPNFEAFKGTMAEIGVDEAGARHIWVQIVQQLFEVEKEYVKTLDPATQRVKMADKAFKELVNNFKVPKELDAAFDREVGKLDGKRVALWSGTPAKDAAATSGKTDVFLEGTPFGKAFDKAGLPKNVPSSWFLWASISKAYAVKLAAKAGAVHWVGFVAHNTVAAGNIAAEIELPAVADAVNAAAKKVTWYGAATEDGGKWSGPKELKAGTEVLTKAPGFWDIGEDRGAVISHSKAQWEKYEKATKDGTASSLDVAPVAFSAGGEQHAVEVGISGADATVNVHSEKNTGLGHLQNFKNKLASDKNVDESLKKEAESQISEATSLIHSTEKSVEDGLKGKDDKLKKDKAKEAESFASKLTKPFKWLFDKVTGNTATRKSLAEVLGATGAVDAKRLERLLAPGIEKKSSPVSLDNVAQTPPQTLISAGRALWRQAAGNDLAWLVDASDELDGGARKVHVKGMMQKLKDGTETTVTQAGMEAFAAKVYGRFHAALGVQGDFTKIFDEEAKAAGLDAIQSAKNKWLPSLELGGIGSILKYTKNFADSEAPAEMATKIPLFKDFGKKDPLLSFEAKTPIIPGLAWVEWGSAKVGELSGAEGAVSLGRSKSEKERALSIGVAASGSGTLASLSVGPTLKLGLFGFSMVSVGFVAELAAKGSIGGELKYTTTKNLKEDKPPAWSVAGSVKAEGKLEGSVKFSVGLDAWVSELKAKKEKVLSNGGDGADNTFDALEGPDKKKVHDALEIDPTVFSPKLEWTLAAATFADFVLELAPTLSKASDDGKARFDWNPKRSVNWHVGRLFAEMTGNTDRIEAFKAKAKAIEDAQKLVDEAKKAKHAASDKAKETDATADDAEKAAKKKQTELDDKKKTETDLRKKAQEADARVAELERLVKEALEDVEYEEDYLAEVRKMPGISEAMLGVGEAKVREAIVRHAEAKKATAAAAEKRDKIKATVKDTAKAVAEVESLLADLRKKADEARAAANEAKKLADEAEKKLDQAKTGLKDTQKKNVKEFTAKVAGGGEEHTAKVGGDGKNYLHSTPRPVADVLGEASSRLKQAAATGGSTVQPQVKDGLALVASASAANQTVEGAARGAGSDDKAAADTSKAQTRLATLVAKVFDVVKAVTSNPEVAGKVANAGKSLTKAGDTAGDKSTSAVDKTKAVAGAVGSVSDAVGSAAGGVGAALGHGEAGKKVAAGAGAVGVLASTTGKVADQVGKYQAAGATGADKAKAVAAGVGAAGAGIGAAGSKIATGVFGNEAAGKKIAAGGGAVADLAGAAPAVIDAVAAVKDPTKKGADKAKAIAGGVGAVGTGVGAAGEKVAGILGHEAAGKKIAAGGGAVADLAGAAPAVIDAVAAVKDPTKKGADKAKAIAGGVGAAGAGVGAAGEKVAGILGNEAAGKKIAAGGGAVADLAGAAPAVIDAISAVRDPSKSGADKTKAIAGGVGAAGKGVGAAGEKIAGILGQDAVGKKIGAGGGAVADLAGAAPAVVDAFTAVKDPTKKGTEKAKAIAGGVGALGTGVGAAGEKVAGILGNEALGKQIGAGGKAVSSVAKAGGSVADAVETLKKGDAKTGEKVSAVAGATGDVATSLGAASDQIVGGILGNKKHAETGSKVGSAVEGVAKSVSSGAKAYDVLRDKEAGGIKKTNAVLDAVSDISTNGGKSASTIAGLMGKEELGKKIGSVTGGVANVAKSGKDVTGAIETFQNKDATTGDKVGAVAKATKSTTGAISGVAQTGLEIAGKKELGEKVGLGGKLIGHGADAVTSVTDGLKTFNSKDATTTDKVKAGYGMTKGVVNAGTAGAETLGKLTGNKALTEGAGEFGKVAGGGFKAIDAGFKTFDSGKDAYKAFKEGKVGDGVKKSVETGANAANTVKGVADVVGMVAKGPVKDVAGKVSNVAGAVGGGIMSGMSAVDNGIKTGKDIAQAAKLSDKSELGKSTKAAVTNKATALAQKYGVDTSKAGWEKEVEAKHQAEKNKALAGGEEAYKKFSSDATVAGYEGAKKIDDLRGYAKNQKIAGATVKGLETAGNVASTIGTFTAGVDGGITKTVGTALELGATGARLGRSAAERAENVSAAVDAQDIMKGYDKKGFIGKTADKVGDAIGRAKDAVVASPVGQAVGKTIDGAKYVGGKVVDGAKYAGGKIADGAKYAGGKIADGASYVGGKVADGARYVGGKVVDGAKAVGGYVGDKAKAVGSAIADSKVGKAVSAGAGKVADGAKYVGGKVADGAKYVGGKVADGAKVVGGVVAAGTGKVADGAKYVGGKVADGAKFVGGKVADGAKAVGGMISGAASTAAGGAKSFGSKLWGGVKSVGSSVVGGVKAAGSAVANSAVGQAIGAGASKVADGAKFVGGKIADGASFVGGKVADGARYAGGKIADGAKYAGGKIADGASYVGGKVVDGAKYAGGKIADGAKYVGGKVVDGAKAAGGFVADKAKAAGSAIANSKVGQAVAAGAGKVADGAKYVGGKVVDGAKYAGGKIADGASYVGGKVADGAKYAGGKIADGAKAVGGAISNSFVGDAARKVSGAVGDAAKWTKENIWETSDMKWARKTAAFLTPQSSEKMLADTQEKWNGSDKAKDLKTKDYGKYKATSEKLEGSKETRNATQLLSLAQGKSGTPEEQAHAQQILKVHGVDPNDPQAHGKIKEAWAW